MKDLTELTKYKDVYLQEVLFEFYKIKNFMRVTAIDPVSGIETRIIGPINHDKEALKKLAIRKLKYVISKTKL